MKIYKKPIAKFIALKSGSPLAGSDTLNVVSGNGDSATTGESLSKSASFTFGDDDE